MLRFLFLRLRTVSADASGGRRLSEAFNAIRFDESCLPFRVRL